MADRKPQRLENLTQPGGILCPECHFPSATVLWTRQQEGKIVRKRQCRKCGREFVTIERAA